MRNLTTRGRPKRQNVRVHRADIPGKMSGWLAQFILGGVVHRRYFSDSRYGTSAEAYAAALAHASECQDEHEELLALQRALARRRSNSTGLPGVFHSEQKEGRGAYWEAFWIGENGRRCTRKFSESVYGAEEARRLAIEARAVGVAKSLDRFAELCVKFELNVDALAGEVFSQLTGPTGTDVG
jgi:hypothetical protein